MTQQKPGRDLSVGDTIEFVHGRSLLTETIVHVRHGRSAINVIFASGLHKLLPANRKYNIVRMRSHVRRQGQTE